MKSSLKFLLLAIILILPVLIYLFLQGFGENQYALPMFPEARKQIEGCGDIQLPYRIESLYCQETDLKDQAISIGDANYLLHFPEPNDSMRVIEGNELRRFFQKTATLSYRLVTFAPDHEQTYWNRLSEAADSVGTRWTTRECAGDVQNLKDCQLLLPLAGIKFPHSESRLVLVDRMGRIRGYYVPSDREEVDRLIIEMDILSQEK